MGVADIAVLPASVAAVAGLAWFFFAPRKASAAQIGGGVQRVAATVRGGYRPDVIRARQGAPLEIVFEGPESGDCTSRVVFADFGLSAALPAFARTTVRLDLARAGSFGFACGLLTAPVLFAVMAHELFGAGWVPSVLLNHWLQFALITPVMLYAGWPIHRTGWLALAHRSADLNSTGFSVFRPAPGSRWGR